MLKTKINPYRHDYDHIVSIMKDMFYAENRACMGEIIKDDYVWIISANIGADPYKHMLYKIFDIEVEIAKYEKDTITLMMKNERRMKMERTCYSCKWHTVNWEPREANKSKIRYNSVTTSRRVPNIKNVIFNDPATIVFWSDGAKTVVKAQDGEPYDEEKGLAMAISKKALGNKGNYCNEFKKWLPEEDESMSINIEYNGTNFLDILNDLNTCVGIKKEK